MLPEPLQRVAAGKAGLAMTAAQFIDRSGGQLGGNALPGQGRVNKGMGDFHGMIIDGWE